MKISYSFNNTLNHEVYGIFLQFFFCFSIFFCANIRNCMRCIRSTEETFGGQGTKHRLGYNLIRYDMTKSYLNVMEDIILICYLFMKNSYLFTNIVTHEVYLY